jgi:prepilin-type N-terminal cleavage/methylation domain-containing protein
MQRFVMKRNGFTLIEILVALAILALVLSDLFRGVSGAVRNDDRTDFLLRASRFGRSQMEAIGVAEPIVVGETTGRSDNGLQWTLTTEPYRVEGTPSTSQKTVGYWIRLTIGQYGVAPNPSNTFTLSTLKLVLGEAQKQ